MDSLARDLALPLLVTFLTYLGSQQLLKPLSKWRELRDKLIIASVQFANYVAYSYIDKEGNRKFEDRGMINTVEQHLRRLAGEVTTLPDYRFYSIWKGSLLPNEKAIDEIRGDLIGWANSLIEKDLKYDPNREVRIESLKKHLGLPNYYSDMKETQEKQWERERKS
ncbi:MAG: hypothetical protein UU21_C0006G0004 [Candidatus Levybacteria bacterium GW2011_GWA2_40_8]|nr:MAG: hypothetical protein UU21_C0006G0004 [Candidatus Levybacteria bacterium GW2011_GWA2_40_8]